MTDGDPAFVVPGNVLHREVDGQMVLLNLDTEQYFGLDEIGAEMVRRITEEPWDQAVEALGEAYEVDPVRLRSDLDELVASLVEARLLTPTEGDD